MKKNFLLSIFLCSSLSFSLFAMQNAGQEGDLHSEDSGDDGSSDGRRTPPPPAPEMPGAPEKKRARRLVGAGLSTPHRGGRTPHVALTPHREEQLSVGTKINFDGDVDQEYARAMVDRSFNNSIAALRHFCCQVKFTNFYGWAIGLLFRSRCNAVDNLLLNMFSNQAVPRITLRGAIKYCAALCEEYRFYLYGRSLSVFIYPRRFEVCSMLRRHLFRIYSLVERLVDWRVGVASGIGESSRAVNSLCGVYEEIRANRNRLTLAANLRVPAVNFGLFSQAAIPLVKIAVRVRNELRAFAGRSRRLDNILVDRTFSTAIAVNDEHIGYVDERGGGHRYHFNRYPEYIQGVGIAPAQGYSEVAGNPNSLFRDLHSGIVRVAWQVYTGANGVHPAAVEEKESTIFPSCFNRNFFTYLEILGGIAFDRVNPYGIAGVALADDRIRIVSRMTNIVGGEQKGLVYFTHRHNVHLCDIADVGEVVDVCSCDHTGHVAGQPDDSVMLVAMSFRRDPVHANYAHEQLGRDNSIIVITSVYPVLYHVMGAPSVIEEFGAGGVASAWTQTPDWVDSIWYEIFLGTEGRGRVRLNIDRFIINREVTRVVDLILRESENFACTRTPNGDRYDIDLIDREIVDEVDKIIKTGKSKAHIVRKMLLEIVKLFCARVNEGVVGADRRAYLEVCVRPLVTSFVNGADASLIGYFTGLRDSAMVRSLHFAGAQDFFEGGVVPQAFGLAAQETAIRLALDSKILVNLRGALGGVVPVVLAAPVNESTLLITINGRRYLAVISGVGGVCALIPY